jgi:acetylornithine/succinyldiaminopimelate/putrescine aminotransferase/predicted amino acid dehydrogenase
VSDGASESTERRAGLRRSAAEAQVMRIRSAVAPGGGRELELENWIRTYVTGICGVPAAVAKSAGRWVEFELDSMEIAGLAVELERRVGKPLPLSLLAECESISELCRRLAALDGGSLPSEERAAAPCGDHPYFRFVTPALGRRIQRAGLDKCFVRGSGCYLEDADGRRYLDLMSSYGALPFGFNPPEIWSALIGVRDALEPNLATPSALEAAGALAERLLEVAPEPLRYAVFTNSGAESVEAAIKLCRAATGRRAVLSMKGAFHGKTLGALSATGNAHYQEGFGIFSQDFETLPFGDLAALETRLAEHPRHYAALLLEPVLGEGGVRPCPVGYGRRAVELCHEYGTLVIADEVQTGLGRTGHLFACVDDGWVPDVMALAKALGGGLVPFGAVLYSDRARTEHFELRHSSTFAGNALGCRAGAAVIELLLREEGALLRSVRSCGERLLGRLRELQRQYPAVIREVRGRGFMIGIEFQFTDPAHEASLLQTAAEQGFLAALASSYLLNAEAIRVAPTLSCSNTLRVAPPLIAVWEQCEVFIEAFERLLQILSRADTGALLRSIEERRPLLEERRWAARRAPRFVRATGQDHRFGFVLHPIQTRDYQRIDGSLDCLSAEGLEIAAERISEFSEPFVASSSRIEAPGGVTAHAEFAALPYTAAQLHALPRSFAVRVVEQAVALLAARGASVVGLGAYASIVTQGGSAVRVPGVALTSGNSFTALAGEEGLRRALQAVGMLPADATVLIAGAAGSTGGAVTALLAGHVRRVILVGNPERSPSVVRAAQRQVVASTCRYIARQIERREPMQPGSIGARLAGCADRPRAAASDAEFLAFAELMEHDAGLFLLGPALETVLPFADAVVLATSAPRPLLSANDIGRGAVICDLSQPRNAGRELCEARPDVLVFDGGVIEVPGRPSLGDFGLEQGLAYACMAETALWALAGRERSASIGVPLSLDEIEELRALAVRFDFKLAGLRSFDRVLGPADFKRVTDARTRLATA